MQNITFRGINSLYTGKKAYSQIGSYVTSKGITKTGPKNYEELIVKCRLTNDEAGRHLSDFENALSKSCSSYQARTILQNFTNCLSLGVKRCTVQDNIGNISNSNFTLNGTNIMPNSRQILPLFTYLAKFTRELAKQPEISASRKELLQKANLSLHEEAVRFIENM